VNTGKSIVKDMATNVGMSYYDLDNKHDFWFFPSTHFVLNETMVLSATQVLITQYDGILALQVQYIDVI
jgi:hypothetical protein